jgi:trigger factor
LKVEYSEETSVRKSLAFEIEAEVVSREIAARAQHYARRVKIPGFRPGKIPPEVIKQRFRQQVLEDVAEKLVNQVVHEELEGRGLRPLATPRVTDLKIDEGQPLTFRAVFETLPLVELPEYKGLQVKARTAEVEEADVERELARLREEAARFDPVEGRPAAPGDFVVLDVDSRRIPETDQEERRAEPDSLPRSERGAQGGAAQRPPAQKDENVLVEVGSADNHQDLNAALTGMGPGETKDVRLVYAEDHPSKSLAGQTRDYTVTMKAVKVKVLPALDDEFAKDLGEWDSLSALRDTVTQRLRDAAERKADREVKSALLESLVEKAGFEVPEALVERHMNARTESAARGLAYQGVDPTKVGMDWKKYREDQRDDSVKAAKADILLDEIARREGIQASDAEVDAEVGRYAESLKKSKESVRARMEKEGDLAVLRARIREEKTLDLLKANARLSDE